MSEIMLDCPGVAAIVGELVAAGMAQHVGVGGKLRPREYFRQGDGPWITERAFRKRGHVLADMDLLGWERGYRQPKHKYVWVEGTWTQDRPGRLRGPRPSEVKRLRAAFKPLPYPPAD